MGELNSRNHLESKIIDVIVEAVHLQHINKASINSETTLTKTGANSNSLDLDSIDVLEIVVAIEHKFGVKVTDAERAKKYFASIGSIAEFIETQSGRNSLTL